LFHFFIRRNFSFSFCFFNSSNFHQTNSLHNKFYTSKPDLKHSPVPSDLS
jgi:hypothetical protein